MAKARFAGCPEGKCIYLKRAHRKRLTGWSQ